MASTEMKTVRATQYGVYKDVLRKPGDEFEVPVKQTGKWFVPASDPLPAAPKGRGKKEPETLNELGKRRPTGPTEPADEL